MKSLSIFHVFVHFNQLLTGLGNFKQRLVYIKTIHFPLDDDIVSEVRRKMTGRGYEKLSVVIVVILSVSGLGFVNAQTGSK